MSARSSDGFRRSVIYARPTSERAPVAPTLALWDEVTMVDVPDSFGWVYALRDDKFGETSAVVVWEHHNGVRALIPVRKLARVGTSE